MPPLPRLRVPVLAELARQLRFEPAKAARRQLELAEALAAQIDPEQTYPEEWVVFRLTGFRPETGVAAQGGKGGVKRRGDKRAARDEPDGGQAPTLIVGAALLADLPPLVERLCVAAGLTEADLEANSQDGAGGAPSPSGSASPAWLDAAAVCERWQISRKTLDRYRRCGLLARRVIGPDTRHRLMFSRSAVEAFEARHRDRLGAAAGFSRIDVETERRMIRRAEAYHQRFGCSLNQAAARLAERFERSHEAVRQLLRRNDEGSPAPIFSEPPPVRERERRIIERALARGIEARTIAQRFGTTETAVYRAAALRRASRLRELDVSGPIGPAFESPDASERYLSPEPVRTGLGRRGPATLAELLEWLAADGAEPADPRRESARAAAYWCLRHRAAALIVALPRHTPTTAALDQIETMLRWASRLRAELVRSQLPLALKTIEGRLERPVTTLPTNAAAQVVTVAIDAVIEAMDRFDPFRGGRAAAPAALALNRAVSQWVKDAGTRWAAGSPPTGPRATPRADPAAARLDDWTRRVSPWQAWLEPDGRIRPLLDRAREAGRAVLIERMGWSGAPPATVADLAARRAVTPAQIVRRERDTIRLLLSIARSAPGG